MAKYFGGFNNLIEYTPDDIDRDFYSQNEQILSAKKGAGFWLWKVYFIYKTLQELNDDDYLVYADTGSFFLKNVDILLKTLEDSNQDIMAFELPLIEKQWTKKELFINMNCNEDKYLLSNQIMSSFHIIKKTKFSVNFYEEFLNYACNIKNITDLHDYEITQEKDFIAHRQDQSIFSLLYKKYNLKPFKDPTQRGEFPSTYALSSEYSLEPNTLHYMSNNVIFRYYKYEDNYTHVLYHNRNQPPLKSLFKYIVKNVLYKIGLYKRIIA